MTPIARLLSLLCAIALSTASARAAPVVVVPLAQRPGADAALQQIVGELSLRCPGARHVSFATMAPLLPRFTQAQAGLAPLPPELADPHGGFFNSDDWPGLAVRFARAAAVLERDPIALLSSPERRLRLRQAYLYAARAAQRAGTPEWTRALARLLVRLPDLPPPEVAEWGGGLRDAVDELRRNLPAPSIEVHVEGPAGWAVHVDEVPVGALPRQQLRLRPGPHAVVAVGPDGTRASWVLDLAAGAPPSLLLADQGLVEACEVSGLLGLCAPASPPSSWQALGHALKSEVLALRHSGEEIHGWRLRRGAPAAPPLRVALSLGPEQIVENLVHGLCPAPAAAQPAEAKLDAQSAGGLAPPGALTPPGAPPPVASSRPAAVLRREGRPRRARWPGVVLLTAGVVAVGLAGGYFAYQGRCVDDGCLRSYDFREIPWSLAGGGIALTLGGALWIGLASR